MAAKIGGRIEKIWFVRAGLANPILPSRTLQELLQDFMLDECKQISHTYVGSVRDAFVEIIKGLMGEQTTSVGARAVSSCTERRSGASTIMEARPVFVPHVHDEASMRLRSLDASLLSRPIRGRSSKVGDQIQTWAIQ
jgi:hypothetical protein